MQLPRIVQEKLKNIYSSIGKNKLVKTRGNVTEKYKNHSGQSQSLISTKDESFTYAISRMPATFSVLTGLFRELKKEGFFNEVNSVSDIGSGTGAGYFAIKSEFENCKVNLFEINDLMIQVFKDISDSEVEVQKLNIINQSPENLADLVVSSYVLSELSDNDRVCAFKNLVKATNNYVLIVDTGTPKTYADYIKLIEIAKSQGFNLLAPCCQMPCSLENDYCAFYSRVERSEALKVSKSGSKSYEDENYFYLLFGKDNRQLNSQRVIRRPLIKEGFVELKLCSSSGVHVERITKKHKDYKPARKIKINEIF